MFGFFKRKPKLEDELKKNPYRAEKWLELA